MTFLYSFFSMIRKTIWRLIKEITFLLTFNYKRHFLDKILAKFYYIFDLFSSHWPRAQFYPCFTYLRISQMRKNDSQVVNLFSLLWDLRVPIKCRWNWHQVSISPAFYKLFFVQKCFAKFFSSFSLALQYFGEILLAHKLFVGEIYGFSTGLFLKNNLILLKVIQSVSRITTI